MVSKKQRSKKIVPLISVRRLSQGSAVKIHKLKVFLWFINYFNMRTEGMAFPLSLLCREKRTGVSFNTLYVRWQLWVKWIFRLLQSPVSLRQPCQLTRLRLSVPCQCQKDNLRPSKKKFYNFLNAA